MQVFFPTIAAADETGVFCAEVIGAGVNGQGETLHAALEDAARSLQEIVWSCVERGEPLPRPCEPSADHAERGAVALLQITVPAEAA